MAENTRLPRTGGSFAPPLDSDRVQAYRELAEQADAGTRKAMLALCDTVEEYLVTYEGRVTGKAMPKEAGELHEVGVGRIIPLGEKTVKALEDYIPQDYEISGMQSHFDKLPNGTSGSKTVESEDFSDGVARAKTVSIVSDRTAKDIRDAAFHLLWFVKELQSGRVPITTDMLPEEFQTASALSEDSPITVRALTKNSSSKAKKSEKAKK